MLGSDLGPVDEHRSGLPGARWRVLALAVAGATALTVLPLTTAEATNSWTVRSGDSLWLISQRTGASVADLQRANGLSGTLIHPGHVLRVPGKSGPAAHQATAPKPAPGSAGPAAKPRRPTAYVVRPGDNPWLIASRLSVPLAALLQANGLTMTSTIYPGDRLAVPGTAASSGVVSKPAPPKAAQQLKPPPKTSQQPKPAAKPGPNSHVVRPGENLSAIAARHGVPLSRLLSLNGLSMSSVIYPGDRLALSAAGKNARGQASDRRPRPVVAGGGTSLPHAVARNRETAATLPKPAPDQVRQVVVEIAQEHGVDPVLALGLSYTESRHRQEAVSYANAIGTMQVLPSTGDWVAQTMTGRPLNLFELRDNVTAGMTFLRWLLDRAPRDTAIAAYYQGLHGVQEYGMTSATRLYVRTVHNHMALFR